MSKTLSPFRRRSLGIAQPLPHPVSREVTHDARRKVLATRCRKCSRPFAFEADQMNNGGMFQLDKGADKCPTCGTEASEVFPLAAESIPLAASEEPAAIDAPAPPAGRVYRRAATARNTAGMGMDPVEGTDEHE